jgi:hypothetical protein
MLINGIVMPEIVIILEWPVIFNGGEDNLLYIPPRYLAAWYYFNHRRCMHLGEIVKEKEELHIAFRDKVS